MNQIRYFSISCVFLLLFVCNLEANTPLFEKYANSAINDASLVERQGLKYQVNTTKPFSGRFLGFEDEFGFVSPEQALIGMVCCMVHMKNMRDAAYFILIKQDLKMALNMAGYLSMTKDIYTWKVKWLMA